jgi:folate-binding protein YgfZ
MSEAATLTTGIAPTPSPLATCLSAVHPNLALQSHAGALTPHRFSSAQREISAALTGTALFDLGYRTRIRVTGEDRVRWLNGMVSNAIQTLPESHGNYNFILNAQGRIQGDACIYRAVDDLFLDTDRSQAPRLLAHLDHFIIMDDVELHSLDDATTGIGLIGPQAAATLDALGLAASNLAPLEFAETSFEAAPVTLVHAYGPTVPRYELWFAPQYAGLLWNALAASGAEPIGIEAVEAIRVLEGTPRFGVDITDRHLPQETSQARALNFSKGCYLGQEIVERIRSRATVHRNLRQFRLEGEIPAAAAELRAADDPTTIGQLTSIAEINLPGFNQTLALGFLRNDAAAQAMARGQRIVYDGGEATALDAPPTPPRP